MSKLVENQFSRPKQGPFDFADSPLSRVALQPFMLGLFLPLQSGGWSPSTLPRSTTWHFDYNAALAKRAEELGFDLVFGLSKWLGKGGYGGETNYHGISLDPFMVANALASVTSRILLVSTLHVLYGPWHPLHLARFGATLDHISGGRWGINVVTGHRASEHRRFGKTPIEHDLRYGMADEFIDIVKEIWAADDNVTLSGHYWNVEEAYEAVKPNFGRPLIVNASGSKTGIDFAARHSDLLFTSSPAGEAIEDAVASLPALVGQVRERAAETGRTVRTLVNPIVICRDTEAEAVAYRDAIIAAADWAAIGGFGSEASDAKAWQNFENAKRGLGSNVIHIVGSPEQVVDQFIQLKKTGVDGVQMSFFDFQPDLEHFGSTVLPLLKQAGLRL